MSDDPNMPENIREVVARAAAGALKEGTERLAHQAMTSAMLGTGVSLFLRMGRKPEQSLDELPSSVVIVLSGPLPEDVIDGLEQYFRGLAQDLDASGLYNGPSRKEDYRDPTQT